MKTIYAAIATFIAFALVFPSCAAVTLEETGFTSIQKHGNTVLLNGPISSLTASLLPVTEASVLNVSDTLCIKSLDDILYKETYTKLVSFEKGRVIDNNKNFSVCEKKMDLVLYLPYLDETGFVKKVATDLSFIRQVPYLNGNDNVYYPASFKLVTRSIEFKQDPNGLEPYSELTCEFEATLCEEGEPVGQFVFTKVFAVKNHQICFNATIAPWQDVNVGVKI